jgi:hypothetical protein
MPTFSLDPKAAALDAEDARKPVEIARESGSMPLKPPL